MSKLIGNQDFNTASHSVYRLTYHVVWCVKFRRHILTQSGEIFCSPVCANPQSLSTAKLPK